jgi:hypothetical protein
MAMAWMQLTCFFCWLLFIRERERRGEGNGVTTNETIALISLSIASDERTNEAIDRFFLTSVALTPADYWILQAHRIAIYENQVENPTCVTTETKYVVIRYSNSTRVVTERSK